MPYCLLMDGLAKSGKLTEAKSVFDEMKQKEVKNGMSSFKSSVLAAGIFPVSAHQMHFISHRKYKGRLSNVVFQILLLLQTSFSYMTGSNEWSSCLVMYDSLHSDTKTSHRVQIEW